MRVLLILLIRVYQGSVSAFLGGHCRFQPSCSSYAIEAISVHGCVRGLVLTANRLLKCHPFNPGGFDPVPECLASGHGIARNIRHAERRL